MACTTLHALLTFNPGYASGTRKDQLEEATLLGESQLYRSDTLPGPASERAGHPEGPLNHPGSVDRVKNVKFSPDGAV